MDKDSEIMWMVVVTNRTGRFREWECGCGGLRDADCSL